MTIADRIRTSRVRSSFGRKAFATSSHREATSKLKAQVSGGSGRLPIASASVLPGGSVVCG